MKEEIKAGDLVEVTRLSAWAGIGVVTAESRYGLVYLVMVTGKLKGTKAGFRAEEFTPVHGYIHVNRPRPDPPPPDYTRWVI